MLNDGLPRPSADEIITSLLEASNNMNKTEAAVVSNQLENDALVLNRSVSVRTMNDGGSVDGDRNNTGEEEGEGQDASGPTLGAPVTHHHHHHHSHQHGRAPRSLSGSPTFGSGPVISARHRTFGYHGTLHPVEDQGEVDSLPHDPSTAECRDLEEEYVQMAIRQSLQEQERGLVEDFSKQGQSQGQGQGQSHGRDGSAASTNHEVEVLDRKMPSEEMDVFVEKADEKVSSSMSSRGGYSSAPSGDLNLPSTIIDSGCGTTILDCRALSPPSRGRAVSTDNANNANNANNSTSIFADEFMSLPAAGAFGMAHVSASNGSNSTRRIVHSESSPSTFSEAERDRGGSSSRRNSPSNAGEKDSAGRTSTLYIPQRTGDEPLIE